MLIQGTDEVPSAAADEPPPPPSLPARADGPAGTRSRGGGVPDAITMAGGLLCVGVGLSVVVAWRARATPVLQFGSKNPMSFNTAVAFAVTGVALVALARGRLRAVIAAGVFDAVVGALSLAEYALGRSFGIDQLVVKAYVVGPRDVPGRMAVNTAVCLTLVGASLLLWGPWRSRRRLRSEAAPILPP